jgi:hypothetical protein
VTRASAGAGAEPIAFLVDDDPKGALRLEGQVIDEHDRPVAGATVVLSSNPPRAATSEDDGGFSFDQFFSDARPSEGGDVVAPAMSPPETGRSGGGAGDEHDIEQFTAWLEGLKKK